ncbi:hypothetical protein HY621_04105 [Candidatus Uhrbacteria bacterium]|nr:hypothetical protein [Candidatus Uhrbacteria bacterium]
MFEEEKPTNPEPKEATPAQPVDMFSGTKEPAASTTPQSSEPETEATEEDTEVQTMDEDDAHQSYSRRNMILALIALVVLLLIIGGAATYFFISQKQKPAQGAVEPTVQQEQTEVNVPQSETLAPPATEEGQSQEPQVQEQSSQAETEQLETPVVEAPKDTDRDGLSDEEESTLQTDVNSADTDSDGLTDREEVQVYKTNPLSADTDSDGFLDKQELDNGFNPNGEGKLPSGIPAAQ